MISSGVSVAIVTSQRPSQLSWCLRALANAELALIREVILVDTRATDDSAQNVASGFAEALPLKYVRHQVDGFALSAARNLAIRHAAEESVGVLFLDDDIVVPQGLIRAHFEQWERGSHLVLGLRDRVAHECWSALGGESGLGSLWSLPKKLDDRRWWLKGTEWRKAQWAYGIGAHFSIDSVMLRQVGGFDERFVGWGFEDTEFFYRIWKAGAVITALTDCNPLHLDDRDSASHEGRPLPHRVPPWKHRDYMRNARIFLDLIDPDDVFARDLVNTDMAIKEMRSATWGIKN